MREKIHEKEKNKEKSSIEKHIKTPWHIWLIGLIFVLIYVIGIYDYFMMLGHNIDYYAYKNYGQAVVEYFTDYPILCLLFWIINVLGGFIAAILLLFRIRWAVYGAFAFAISMLCLDIITFTFRNRWKVLWDFIRNEDLSLKKFI